MNANGTVEANLSVAVALEKGAQAEEEDVTGGEQVNYIWWTVAVA
jgi:hypothetical protein